MGMFYRTIRLVENGIKPVYVFDGKPPEMKSDEVSKCFLVESSVVRQILSAPSSLSVLVLLCLFLSMFFLRSNCPGQ